MITSIRKAVSGLLCVSGVAGMLNKAGKKDAVILAYHRVGGDMAPDRLDPGLISASAEDFDAQMRYLSGHCNVISLDALTRLISKGIAPPPNTVVITFDDGYKDNYTVAYPILRRYNLPATIFLATDVLEKDVMLWWDEVAYAIWSAECSNVKDLRGRFLPLRTPADRAHAIAAINLQLKDLDERTKRQMISGLWATLGSKKPSKDAIAGFYLSWAEINEMSRHSISFGAHTLSHPILTGISHAQAKAQIAGSKLIIEKRLGRRVSSFSYPNGFSHDFNDDIKGIVRRAGFGCALTYIPGSVGAHPDPFALNRLFVRSDEGLAIFRTKLLGLDTMPARMYLLLAGFAGKTRV